MNFVDDLGLLCLAIDSGTGNQITGRTKLQKMIYFCKYLGWNVSDYKLHYYGPFSFVLADTLKTAENSEFVNQDNNFPPTFTLNSPGKEFLDKFKTEVCDPDKVTKTRDLIAYLSTWSKQELEVAATLDFVSKTNPGISEPDLISKVGIIKDNFTHEKITDAYKKLLRLKKEQNLNYIFYL